MTQRAIVLLLFRRLRDDGVLGEEIRFDVAADGTPVRVWRHSNFEERPATRPRS